MSRASLGGVEVPIPGTDAVKWIDVTVAGVTAPSAPVFAEYPARDFGSCSTTGNPNCYFVWRYHKNTPRVLELHEFSGSEESPGFGLRMTFPEPLFPSVHLCDSEVDLDPTRPRLLYVMTLSGVAYLFKLRRLAAYSSSAVFPRDDVIECNISGYLANVLITSVVAKTGCLLVGKSDGLVSVFRLGSLDPNAPGFMHEMRDDAGLGRLWGLMSRGRTLGTVQDMKMLEFHGAKVLLQLNSDGTLRAWELLSCSKILNHTMTVSNLEGASPVKLWTGQPTSNSTIVPVAILYEHVMEISKETICVFNLRLSAADKIMLSVDSTMQAFPLDDGECIEVQLTSDTMWILKDNGLVSHNLSPKNSLSEGGHSYALHEEFVAEQLFQNAELSDAGLLCIVRSASSVAKDHNTSFVSSIFVHRLLHPGVYQDFVMQSTFLDYNRHLGDAEFQALTYDGLKKEISLLIEHEGTIASPQLLCYNWKNFCHHYFHHWCKNNSPCGLMHHSSNGAVGLVRKNSVSVFRELETIEQLIDGVSDEHGDSINIVSDLSDDDSEREILLEVIRCVVNMSHQLGKTTAAIFYESVISMPVTLSEDIVSCLLRILDAGFIASASSLHRSYSSGDFTWEKEILNHKNLRKFSVGMLLSLNALFSKAASWSKVFTAIQGYLQFLVPRKIIQKFAAQIPYNMNSYILVQATSQIAKLMFESTVDILLFVSYLCSAGRQIHMMDDDISRIQLELIPMIQETVFDWLAIYFLCTTPSQSLAREDFSSQLSSLHIESTGRQSWKERLGRCNFTLASILLLTTETSTEHRSHICSNYLLNGNAIVSSVQDFTSWILWGKNGAGASSFVRRSIDLALVLLRHGQYSAVEHLLITVEANSQREKTSKSFQDAGGDWCVLQHLLGCCFLAQAWHEFHGLLKEKKVVEAIQRFFRASSGPSAAEALQSLSCDSGLPHLSLDKNVPAAAWKLHYYQWAMQIFEQYDLYGGACQFALAALEQVDEAFSENGNLNGEDAQSDSVMTVKGRLWANVFKFMLDQNHLQDAYCAILSNPDDESKYICLRRFIIVLYERGAMKVLCNGQLPFIGLAEKIEQELAWKAGRSDILAKPSPYKFLYAFEMRQQNWRKAASYMYQYSTRLRMEVVLKDQQKSAVLQERLNGLSAAINALNLVHPQHAWIDPLPERNSLSSEYNPSKRSKGTTNEHDNQPRSSQYYVCIEDLENEFLLSSAEHLLSLANVRCTYTAHKIPSDLVDLLVEANIYDMALTLVLKFWKGSSLLRELEKVFTAMSLQCCPNIVNSLSTRMLGTSPSSMEMVVRGSIDALSGSQQPTGNTEWENLELYLERYRSLHAGLPSIVAGTLLRTDSQIELPLWLVHMFKDGRRDRMWGMTGKESNSASLFRLYVNYGRYMEATNLLLEYIDSYASVRPSELFSRKKPFTAWFPYTAIEQLWCQLEESIKSGHMVDQCDKLKGLIHGALRKHLTLLKVDSEDALASAAS